MTTVRSERDMRFCRDGQTTSCARRERCVATVLAARMIGQRAATELNVRPDHRELH